MTSAHAAADDVEELRWKLTKILAPAAAAASALAAISLPEDPPGCGHTELVRVIYTVTPAYVSSSYLQ